MMPGMNSRQMKMAMKKMGIQQVEIEATEVIIKTPEFDLVIPNPSVSKVNMMGQDTYQVVGEALKQEKDTTPEISEEDVKTVMEQANVDEETARKSIEEAEGDLAEAILKLQ